MDAREPSDEDLLVDGGLVSFEIFYRRHERAVLAYFARRAPRAEVAADLASETWAALLASREKFAPERGSALAWLFGIAGKRLAAFHRRGAVEDRARRRLAMERVELGEDDIAHIERLRDDVTIMDIVEELPSDEAAAVRARFGAGRAYQAIAGELGISEPAARKRVSRGLARLRRRLEDERT
jgi:RNA polymerase sigma factor (sigma-70 family)